MTAARSSGTTNIVRRMARRRSSVRRSYEGVLEVGHGERIEARTRRQHDGRRVGRVQPDEITGDLLDRVGGRGEVVAGDQATTSLVGIDVAHAQHVATGAAARPPGPVW